MKCAEDMKQTTWVRLCKRYALGAGNPLEAAVGAPTATITSAKSVAVRTQRSPPMPPDHDRGASECRRLEEERALMPSWAWLVICVVLVLMGTGAIDLIGRLT